MRRGDVAAPAAFAASPVMTAILVVAWLLVLVVQRWRTPWSEAVHTGINAIVTAALAAWLLHFGAIDWSVLDWTKEWAYLSTLQDAVKQGSLPWMLQEPFQGTQRYLAIPETVAGPQAILLLLMSPATFVLLQTTGYALAGVLAVRRLANDLALTPAATLVFIVLLLLNGHIVAHLTAGHTQWAAYFLLPWVFHGLVRLARGDDSRANAAVMALTFAAMVAAGGWHVLIWAVIFSMAGCAMHPRAWRFTATLLVLAGAVTAFRVLPGATVFAYGFNAFESGFPNVALLLQALVGEAPEAAGMDSFEFDTYIGWSGLVVSGIGLASLAQPAGRAVTRTLWFPSVLMVVLSLGHIYGWTLFRLPAFNGERVSSRLAVVGILGLCLLGCARVSEWVGASRPLAWVASAGALVLIVQLAVHAEAGRIPAAGSSRNEVQSYALAGIQPDPAYRAAVLAGAAVSVAGIGFCLWSIRRR